MRRGGERALDVAAAELVIGQHAGAGLHRVVDRDRGLRLRDVDLRQPRGASRLVAGARDDGEQGLAVKQDFLVGEQRFVGERGGDVVLAGNVGRGEHSDDAGRRANSVEIERAQRSRRLVGHADADMQRARGLADVVDIGRGPAHVHARRIVRMRLVDDRGVDFQRHDGKQGLPIQQHGGLRGGSGRRRPRFPSARAATDWRRLRCGRRRWRACLSAG